MRKNRLILEELFGTGEIALRRSSLFDESPELLPHTFSFDRIDGMMLGLAIGDAMGITTESFQLLGQAREKWG